MHDTLKIVDNVCPLKWRRTKRQKHEYTNNCPMTRSNTLTRLSMLSTTDSSLNVSFYGGNNTNLAQIRSQEVHYLHKSCATHHLSQSDVKLSKHTFSQLLVVLASLWYPISTCQPNMPSSFDTGPQRFEMPPPQLCSLITSLHSRYIFRTGGESTNNYFSSDTSFVTCTCLASKWYIHS